MEKFQNSPCDESIHKWVKRVHKRWKAQRRRTTHQLRVSSSKKNSSAVRTVLHWAIRPEGPNDKGTLAASLLTGCKGSTSPGLAVHRSQRWGSFSSIMHATSTAPCTVALFYPIYYSQVHQLPRPASRFPPSTPILRINPSLNKCILIEYFLLY